MQPNADTLTSPMCMYSDFTFTQHYIPNHHISDPMVPATYNSILWDSPMARSVWTKAREILDTIRLDLTASSYHEAIWELVNSDATDGDETEKLRSVTIQNVTIFALWVLYSADKKINELKQTDQVTNEKVDNLVRTVTENFERMVHDEISVLLHHRREIALNTKITIDGRATTTFSEREKVPQRLKFTVINLDKLTTSQIDLFELIWQDLVEFTNQSLAVLPFRREPP